LRSKLAISALVVASLFGATAIAAAQTDPAQPAPAASAKANGAGSKMATHHKMTSSHKNYRYSRAQMDKSRPGGRPISWKPAGT
jgi:Spy/CpxP family protein refolding chaperone